MSKNKAQNNADAHYAAINRARDKRKARRERNQKILLSGGYTQVPILKCPR